MKAEAWIPDHAAKAEHDRKREAGLYNEKPEQEAAAERDLAGMMDQVVIALGYHDQCQDNQTSGEMLPTDLGPFWPLSSHSAVEVSFNGIKIDGS